MTAATHDPSLGPEGPADDAIGIPPAVFDPPGVGDNDNEEEVVEQEDLSGGWEPTPMTASDVNHLCSNKYVDDLYKSSSLKLLKERKTIRSWKDNGCLGLFRLFYNGRNCKMIMDWTRSRSLLLQMG